MTPGRVRFVGCGPGAPDLLTLRAVRAIAEADVVVWSTTLVDEAVIAEHAAPGATLLAWPPATQRDVLAVYDRAVSDGLQVVVCKGGDPTLFGRLEEDLRAVRDRRLDYEIVPGISAVAAGVAALGCDLAAPFMVVAAGGSDSAPATCGVLGAGRDPHAVAAEIDALGMGPQTPCAVLVGVSRPAEIIVTCRLDELAETIADYGFRGLTTVLAGAALTAARATR
jgi:precorrin-4/cobalt-precorrin-4 C11-methyltransferase